VNPVFYQSSDIRLTPCDRATADSDRPRIESDANALQPGGPANWDQFQDCRQPEQTVSFLCRVDIWADIHPSAVSQLGCGLHVRAEEKFQEGGADLTSQTNRLLARTARRRVMRSGEVAEKTVEVIATDFEAMEAAVGSQLDEPTRASIVEVLHEFERDCALVARSKRRTELAVDVVKVIQKIQQKHGPTWRETAAGRSDLSAALRTLEQLQKRTTGRKAPPAHVRVWKLLLGLEAIFKKAGGRSTGIHRGDRKARGGPFLEFAGAAVRCLPGAIRPQGIESKWEEICSLRRQGRRPLVTMTLPQGFSFTLSSRRPRRR
jgi:hypothetical protein